MRTRTALLLAGLATVAQAAREAPIDPETGLPKRPIGGSVPRINVAIVALVLFGLLAAIQWMHLIRMGRRYMLVLCLGTTAMAAGFVLKIVLSQGDNAYMMGLYIIEQLFILLSPCAFLAADYVILTRISAGLGQDVADECLVLRTSRVVKVFVFADITTFLIQAAGGGMSAIQSIAQVGQKIALVGLVLQFVSFASFTAILLVFGYRVHSRYPSHWNVERPLVPEPSLFKFWSKTPISNWRILYFAVCYTCPLILTRSAFRIAEYAQGYSGYLLTHEAYFYCLDSLPLFFAMGVYVFIWPTRFINAAERDTKEEVGESPASSTKEA